ncbi:hypothetical protein PN441_20495 [Spirulina major CS-329]|uniref:hypothetical protein n=1 Tax=Spirulina TaxID=1154 RepID=UPI00232AF006|nr:MULTISPECIES: hypothetical protein [Spirulina]MDB9495822.1 hypothetical protein [Spirulina subsalsa CS-330]MDB9505465.1 hypothetical protein [Spirulina major CS-329]
MKFTFTLLHPALTLLAILVTFAVNAWSNIDPIGGESIGAISNNTFGEVVITPANYAFIIWGVIYLGLITFGVYQLLPRQRDRADLNPVRHALILSSVAQIVWVFLFLSRLFWGSMVAMGVILAALIWGYGQWRDGGQSKGRERWFVDYPLSLYFGWISVATVVNGATALYSSGWTELGFGAAVWACVMVGVATLLGIAIALYYRDGVYPGVLIWAFVAIAQRQAELMPVGASAIAGAVLLVGAIAHLVFR